MGELVLATATGADVLPPPMIVVGMEVAEDTGADVPPPPPPGFVGVAVPPLPPPIFVGVAVPPLPPPPPIFVGCPVTPGTGVEGAPAGDGADVVVVVALAPVGAKVDPTAATGTRVVVPFVEALGASVVPPFPFPLPIAVGVNVDPMVGVGAAVNIAAFPGVVGVKVPPPPPPPLEPVVGVGTAVLDAAPGEGADVMTWACAKNKGAE